MSFKDALRGYVLDKADENLPADFTVRLDWNAPYQYSEYTAGGGDFWLQALDSDLQIVWSKYIDPDEFAAFFNELLEY